jgi:fibro-slime domain-containing protein
MSNSLSCLSRIFAAMSLFAPMAFAQPPTDDLNGKTIHLHVESDDFNAFYFQNGDLPFTVVSKYNYSITLTGQDIYKQDFFFTSNGTVPDGEHFKWKFGKLGLNAAAEGRITVPDFQGKDTMWVIVDPAGPVTAPPVILLEAPKSINVLNPWTTTAPKLVYGTKTRAMSTTPGRCGWFTTLILDPTLVAGHFAEINNTDTYGKGGLTSKEDFDFAAEFASKGDNIWLNTEANAWTRTWPNKDGDCQYMMAATVRDFSKDHPDFDFGNITGERLTKGMVQSILGPDRKPISTGIGLPAPLTYGLFDKWWVTDTANADPKLRSYASCIDIPMGKARDGLWEYDSYRNSPSDHSFFPAEGTANNKHGDILPSSCYVKPPPDSTSWVTSGPFRNGNFCMESHATFIYQPGQNLAFRGDDDVWIFINDQLVVDLGGVHTPKSDSVGLDKLNLTAGKEYNWDFFYCDRQPCGSALRMKTSIYLRQRRALFGKPLPGPTPGSISLEIWKRARGPGSCASIANNADSIEATSLVYQVLNASGAVVKDLGAGGVFYGGAINIATPLVTVDTAFSTAAWDTLTPGATYRVVAFEPANPALKVEIPFRIPGSATGLIRRKPGNAKHGSARSRNVLGRVVPVFPNRVHSPAAFEKDPAAVRTAAPSFP